MHWGSVGEGIFVVVLICGLLSLFFGSEPFKLFIKVLIIGCLLAVAGFFIAIGIHGFNLLIN